jgi:hypothetical protein
MVRISSGSSLTIESRSQSFYDVIHDRQGDRPKDKSFIKILMPDWTAGHTGRLRLMFPVASADSLGRTVDA